MEEYNIRQKLMGTNFKLGVIARNVMDADHFLEMGISEIKRIENLISEFLPDSDTTKINKYAISDSVIIEKECFDLIQRSNAISKLTNGDFDITVSPLKNIYQFKNSDFEMPDQDIINDTLKSVGYTFLNLNKKNLSVKFIKKNMKISFAAIGKGYASDMVKKLWKENGVLSGYINASGDLNAFGNKPDGKKWKIAIGNPDQKDHALLFVPLDNASVATSGDAEQHFFWKGIRYSHNINPHSGMPLKGIKSVTVFSPGAELSDALATAVYVKGIVRGLDFINQLPNSHCIIICDKNKIYFSKNLQYEAINN